MEEASSKPEQGGPIIFDGMRLPPFVPLVQDARKRFEDIQNLHCRKDDVIVVTYPKSGTHWLWEIVSMIQNRKAEYLKLPSEFFFMEAMPDLKPIDEMASPRTLSTHCPYRWLPKQLSESGGKIVHVIRNPKDVCVSLYHHLKSSGELGEIKDFKNFYETEFMNPKDKIFDGWFKYVKDFEQAQNNDGTGTIIAVHFESMKKNPIEETKRLANLLNVSLNDRDFAEIADKCSFKKLQKAVKTVKDYSGLELGGDFEIEEMKTFIYRKGEIGDWKNHFTVAMNEHFDAIFREEMKDSKIQIQFE